MNEKPMTPMAASRDFFGLRADQKSALDFGKEWKALSEQDRAEIVDGLKSVGYTIVAPTPTGANVGA